MNVQELLDNLDGVKRTSSGWIARCPAHPDRTPSLSVGVGDTGALLLTCFAGCHITDIAAALGLRVSDLFADRDGEHRERKPRPRPAARPAPEPLPTDYAQMSMFVDIAHNHVLQGRGNAAVAYATARFGIDLADAVRLKLGYADHLGGGPRLVVPFLDGWGVARGLQARALDPKATVRWLSPASPQRGTWSRVGWFRGRDLDAPAIITEGPGDALSAVALGFHAIAIRGAGSARDAHTQEIVRGLAGGRMVLIAGDGDAAGRGFTDALADALLAAHAWAVPLELPDGMDLTDYRARDPDGCRDWLASYA